MTYFKKFPNMLRYSVAPNLVKKRCYWWDEIKGNNVTPREKRKRVWGYSRLVGNVSYASDSKKKW